VVLLRGLPYQKGMVAGMQLRVQMLGITSHASMRALLNHCEECVAYKKSRGLFIAQVHGNTGTGYVCCIGNHSKAQKTPPSVNSVGQMLIHWWLLILKHMCCSSSFSWHVLS
jgi:hypothetical protein